MKYLKTRRIARTTVLEFKSDEKETYSKYTYVYIKKKKRSTAYGLLSVKRHPYDCPRNLSSTKILSRGIVDG